MSRREEISRALQRNAAGRRDAFRGQRSGRRVDGESSKYFRNNVAGGINLLDAMVEADVRRLVFSSTCATFGPPERVPIDETLPQRPINPYGESKLMFEKILRWYDEIHGLNFVSLRYFNAAGATEKFGEDHRCETHLIPNVLKVALGQKPQVDIYGTDYETPDGTCIRDYIHILDLSRAHILALGAKESAFYNLGTGGGTSVREVIEICREVTGKKIPVVEKPRRPGDPPRLIAASDKIKSELGWKPQFENCTRSSRAPGVGTRNSPTATGTDLADCRDPSTARSWVAGHGRRAIALAVLRPVKAPSPRSATPAEKNKTPADTRSTGAFKLTLRTTVRS